MWSLLSLGPIALLSLSLIIPIVYSQDEMTYKNSSYSALERAKDLLQRMTWEEKIGQMGGVRVLLGANLTFNETTYNSIHELQNGILGFGYNLNNALDVLPIANTIRAQEINGSRLEIPYITVTDSVNSIYLPGGTLFPSTLSMSASWNLPLYEQVISAIRDENVAIGVRWVLSPELDVARELRNGRVGEMYGEDQYLNGVFGTSYVKTMQKKDENGYMKVATTIKHFVYGSPTGGINTASQNGGLNHLFNDLILPFVTVIKNSQPASIMISYASIDREPMSANRFMMQTILRENLGFDGVLMSDAEAILHLYTQSKVAKSLEDAALRALKAGLQLELSPAQPAAFPTLLSSINSTLVRERIDDAVLKILVIKFQTGVFDEGLPQVTDAKAILRSDAHLAINHNMSRESIVLLQNDGILPLRKSNNGSWPKTAVIGPFANIINPGSYAPNNSTDRSFGKSLYQSMVTAFGYDRVSYTQGVDIIGNDTSGIKAAVQAAKEAELAVLMLGSLSVITADPLFDKRTDGEFFAHADLGFPGRQQDLLNEILSTGVPTVLILSGGQAFVLNDQTLQSNAILHSFLGGEYTADSLLEILTGDVNPSGKLTISMPQSTGAIPIYYNYLPSDNQGGPGVFALGNFSTAWQFPELPRTPPTMAFGYGLSYTTFECSNAQISSGDSVQVTVDVQNTGNVAGKEVVQLYFRPELSVIEFPVKKLIRFEKVELAPGESITVNFTVPAWDLGYYRNMEWEVETGAYNFWVGSSSLDHDLISLNTTVA